MNPVNPKSVFRYFIMSLWIACGILFFPGNAPGEKSENADKNSLPDVESVITVKVREEQSIRDISEEYLNNPDLWEDVLRANNLKFAHEITPGMTLRIPAGEISQANKGLELSQQIIQKATRAGAKLFAPETIANAVKLRNTAIEKRKNGEWAACAESAKSALDEATKALEISLKKQDVPAEAVVTFSYGQVHYRKPSDNIWKDVSVYKILQEGDRLRTLSQSYAHILFKDDSRLYLKENSQAMIRRMRANLLENTEEAKVSLIEGDVLALLVGDKTVVGSTLTLEPTLEVEVPGVQTKIKSRQFWISHDDQESRFANYDNGAFEVSSGGENVVLKENQGTTVSHDQKPSDPRQLLPAPRLPEPDENTEGFQNPADVNPVWEKITGASFYIIEIAKDQSFTDIIWTQEFQEAKGEFPLNLDSGDFYWRVTSVSADKLRGRSGEPRHIKIIKDNEPPFLVIHSPAQDATVSEPQIEISGNTEEGIQQIIIQNQQVKPEEKGEFRHKLDLVAGKNTIIVKATDSAGNITELKRIISYFPKRVIPLSFDAGLYQDRPNHFFVGQHHFALSGKTEPGCSVSVMSADNSSNPFSGAGIADDNGEFQINIKLVARSDKFIIEIISRSGKIIKEEITVEIDDTPPVISFSYEIPSATAQKKTEFSGTVQDGNYLELNGEAVPIQDKEGLKNYFMYPAELNPGVNHLNFLARDQVGNIATVVKEIFLDLEPPEITDYSFSPHKAEGGESVTLMLKAKDATGLVKAAPFSVMIGKYGYTGHILRTGSDGNYSGSFIVPRNVKGEVKLKSVKLSDYLGNSKEYNIGIEN